MPKLRLTWDKRNKRWKKKINGIQEYFGRGESNGDRESYDKAIVALKTRLDELANIANTEEDKLNQAAWGSMGSFARPNIEQMRRAVARFDGVAHAPKRVATVGKCLEEFATYLEACGDAGQLAQSNKNTLLSQVDVLAKLLGPEKPITVMGSGKTFLDLKVSLLAKIKAKEYKPRTARTYMGLSKRAAFWLVGAEYIEKVPDILLTKNSGLGVRVPKKKIVAWGLPETHWLLSNASERTQLYILFALNCGMTQVDISDLAPSEVDWKLGTITRKRSKEKDEENVPTVCWKLWPRTLELLKKHRSKSKTRVLVNENGTQLRSWENGKNIDNVRSAFERLLRKLKIKEKKEVRRTFKSLRKTASTVLAGDEHHVEYARYAQYFLGHAPDTTADSFYVVPPQHVFDKAVLWLGEQFLPAVKVEAEAVA
jgi:integrase